ncbi:MAG: extensin family protein, partial [Paracoccaceae bacterium]
MWRLCAMIGVLALPVWAEAPETSIRPQPRPGVAQAEAPPDPDLAAAAVDAALDAVAEAAPEPETEVVPPAVRPRPRPALPTETAAAEPAAAAEPEPRQRAGFLGGLFGAPRPRPERDARPQGNGICGNPALSGEALPPIRSRTNGCGVDDPVQITAVDGIRLTMAATMDCTTANALSQWVDQGLRPAFEGQEIAGIQVAAHYICRTRNNRPGARISEH